MKRFHHMAYRHVTNVARMRLIKVRPTSASTSPLVRHFAPMLILHAPHEAEVSIHSVIMTTVPEVNIGLVAAHAFNP